MKTYKQFLCESNIPNEAEYIKLTANDLRNVARITTRGKKALVSPYEYIKEYEPGLGEIDYSPGEGYSFNAVNLIDSNDLDEFYDWFQILPNSIKDKTSPNHKIKILNLPDSSFTDQVMRNLPKTKLKKEDLYITDTGQLYFDWGLIEKIAEEEQLENTINHLHGFEDFERYDIRETSQAKAFEGWLKGNNYAYDKIQENSVDSTYFNIYTHIANPNDENDNDETSKIRFSDHLNQSGLHIEKAVVNVVNNGGDTIMDAIKYVEEHGVKTNA